MSHPTLIKSIQTKLSQTSDDLEKFHLLTEMSVEYKKVWKLRKALETSQEALKISHALLKGHPRIRKKRPSFFKQKQLVKL